MQHLDLGFSLKRLKISRAEVVILALLAIWKDLTGDVWQTLVLRILAKYGELPIKAGYFKPELAHRWILWNSALDVEEDFVVLEAGSTKQLRQTVEDIKEGSIRTMDCE